MITYDSTNTNAKMNKLAYKDFNSGVNIAYDKQCIKIVHPCYPCTVTLRAHSVGANPMHNDFARSYQFSHLPLSSLCITLALIRPEPGYIRFNYIKLETKHL